MSAVGAEDSRTNLSPLRGSIAQQPYSPGSRPGLQSYGATRLQSLPFEAEILIAGLIRHVRHDELKHLVGHTHAAVGADHFAGRGERVVLLRQADGTARNS